MDDGARPKSCPLEASSGDDLPFRKGLMQKPVGQVTAVGSGIGAVVLAVVGFISQQAESSNDQLRNDLIAMREKVQDLQTDVDVIKAKLDAAYHAQAEYKRVVAESLGEIKEEIRGSHRRR